MVPNTVSAQPLVNFGSFKFKKLRIKDLKGDKDRVDLKGTFTLGAESNGIDPVNESVTVTIECVDGSTVFSQTILPGSFKRHDGDDDDDDDNDRDKAKARDKDRDDDDDDDDKDRDKDKDEDDDDDDDDKDRSRRRRFKFKSKVKGKLEEIRIEEKGRGRFEFRIKGKKLQFACHSPTVVTLLIGDDAGAFDLKRRKQIAFDRTPPVVTAPADITVAAVDSAGTSASDPAIQTFLGAATSLDNVDGPLTPGNNAPSVFPLGPTPVTFTATDAAGNTGTATAAVAVVDQTPPVVTSLADIIIVEVDKSIGAPADTPTIVAFLAGATALDNVDGMIVPGNDAPPSFPLGSTIVTFTATDAAGNTGSATAIVTVQDETPPVIAITDPADLSLFNISPITVTGTVNDPTTTVVVNGVPAPVSGGTFSAPGVPLQEGPNPITATATDLAENQAQATIQVTLLTPPVVVITQPPNLAVVNQDSITVSGTIDDPAATVVVNEVAATVSGGTFTAPGVPLQEGNNLITAVATDPAGTAGTASIQVTRDTAPPRVTIDSPPDAFVTNDSSITVTGMINDIVVGTVNGDQAQVTVNGIAAEVANRSFLADAVPLTLGPNTITASGTDRAGNSASTSITVTREEILGQPQIGLVSGNNQKGAIGAQLLDPLVVVLTDGDGNPASGKTVIFKVMENNGTLSGSAEEVRSLALTTDAQGRAQGRWRLGTRAGAGNNMVEAKAVGFAGMALFTATALPAAPDKINVDAGNNQTGVGGQPLPRPFVAVVTDAGHNRLADVPVTFTVTEGGGSFNGQPSITVNTDSDGRALAVLALAFQEGFDNNVVEATFPENPGAPARFVASGRAAGDPAETKISGVVLDNTDQPVTGVTMRIEGTALETPTDAQGQFVIQPAPVGHVKLIADGSTAQRPGTWPSLEYDLVTVAGQDNTIGMPIFLLPLDLPNQLCVTPTTGGILTLPQVPGFSLTVLAGSATFPGGSQDGCISVTVVHADKIPMTPNFGQQPRFIVTIQPAGVLFDPPAPISLPNADGLAPREVTDMYSFDHDLGQFVSIGSGTVSEDGTVINSDPGVGIIKGGWHCGGNPARTGCCCACNECERCTDCQNGACAARSGGCRDDGNECTGDVCQSGSCTHPPRTGSCTDDGNECTRDECQSGNCSHPPDDKDFPDDLMDCVDIKCRGGVKIFDPDDDETQNLPDDKTDCINLVCEGGFAVPKPDDDEIPPGGEVDDLTDCVNIKCKGGRKFFEPDDDETPPGGGKEDKDDDCFDFICKDGLRVPVFDAKETPKDDPLDCKKFICTANGPDVQPDDSETKNLPDDEDGGCTICDCVNFVCKGGELDTEVDNSEPGCPN